LAKASLAAALLVTGATAARAEIGPSSVPEIVAAVKDCTAAAGASGVSEQSLLGAGWSRGTMEKDGKAVEVAMSFYGKAKTNSMIMTDAANGKAAKVCFVTARFNKVTDYQQLIKAIDALDNTDPLQRQGLMVVFSNGRQMIQTAFTGSRERPATRIAVAAVTAAAKK
jgi:hypothetical protein